MGTHIRKEGYKTVKTISQTEMKLLKASQLKDGECLNVTADGETIGYFVANPQGEMKARIEGICGLIDNSKGF